ncbi:hypothetical protein [Deinococcus cellulosilyticus]|uniref:DUF1573 domain-containing protein n=1 Tax=Deinococcus cellulosilyticus (strain DSM 18568 / NBRC 106333 / KACC 11606 / 5516J-15) TaxID=1223518 RepID=A0A511MVH6_DEIC1|nr:hypothetical protein [Deinococcus cellulosilyticus]GEM44584.1 hypothetical protein DC3_02190 [Deinococcus cellulosilyticus NBRC 106333 = KACC 11606]
MKKQLAMLVLMGLMVSAVPTLAHNGFTGVGTTLSYKTDPAPLKATKEGMVRFLFTRENQTQIQAKECSCTILVYSGIPDPKVRPVAVGKIQQDKESLFFKFTPPKSGVYTLVLDAKPTKHDDFQVLKMYLPLMAE